VVHSTRRVALDVLPIHWTAAATAFLSVVIDSPVATFFYSAGFLAFVVDCMKLQVSELSFLSAVGLLRPEFSVVGTCHIHMDQVS